MQPDELNAEERLEKESSDQAPPFTPANPPRDPDLSADDDNQPVKDLDDTHPATDTGIDSQDAYDAGIGTAAGAEEPR